MKPFELNLRYLGQRKHCSGKMYWITFWWSWPKFTAGILINKKFACLQDKVRTTEPSTTKLGSYISLVTLITWLTFCHFFWKFRMCFLKVKHSIGHISGMVGPIDVKWKEGASVGYRVNYVTLTFDLTHDLDLSYSRLNFKIAISGIVIWLMWNKKKANLLDNGLSVWFCPLATPMALTL